MSEQRDILERLKINHFLSDSVMAARMTGDDEAIATMRQERKEAADEIASLRERLSTAEADVEKLVDAFHTQTKRLASARKALEEIVARTYSTDRRCRLEYEPVAEICDIAKAALSDDDKKV